MAVSFRNGARSQPAEDKWLRRPLPPRRLDRFVPSPPRVANAAIKREHTDTHNRVQLLWYAMARNCGCGNAKMEDVAFYNGHKAPYARCHAHEIRAHMRPPQIFTTAHVYPFSTTFRAHTQTDGNGPPLVRVAPRALRSRVALCFVPRPRGSVIVLSHVTNYIASSRPPGILRGDAPLRYPPTRLS